MKVADKKKLMIEAGFEPPGSFRCGDKRYNKQWCVPRDYLPELGDTGIDALTVGKMMPFDEAWNLYERCKSQET